MVTLKFVSFNEQNKVHVQGWGIATVQLQKSRFLGWQPRCQSYCRAIFIVNYSGDLNNELVRYSGHDI